HAHETACHVKNARRDPVRTKAVDHPAVSLLPQYPSEPERRTNEKEIVDFVEIPFVEEEQVEAAMLPCQLLRSLRRTNVEMPGDRKTDKHGEEGTDFHPERHMMEILEYRV